MTMNRYVASRVVSLFVGMALLLICAGQFVLAQAPPKEPVHPEPERKHGWAWNTPPDQVTPISGIRNNVFYVGEPVIFAIGKAAATYEVRDYYGDLVDQGPTTNKIAINVKQPGWYKLYLYGTETRKEWGDIVGTTTFVIFRDDKNFPKATDPKLAGSSNYGAMDQVMRAVTGMGPQRHFVGDASKPDEAIKGLRPDLQWDASKYLSFDPVRKRALMIAFPNGTKDSAGVRKVVSTFKNTVKYWEPRNEPNGGSSGADFVTKELIPFYRDVKAADPTAKVMGPGIVSIGPMMQTWLDDFFKTGGAKYIDVFSFHVYNGINGDLWMGRQTMDTLRATLAKYGVENIEKWQTEQGYFAAVYGAYQPRLQGRWTMLEMMLFEQYGLPKEHNHLWYDVSHGFWDFPTWWENDGGGLNPAAPLMRVYAEEVYGTKFAKAYDMGKDGNKLYLGSLFTGPERSVATFMNAGSGINPITVKVTGADELRVVSAFGVESDVKVKDGLATLNVPELPIYVELAKNQTLDVVPMDWGQNLALQPGAVAAAGSDVKPPTPDMLKNMAKLNNGIPENWYYAQTPDTAPWASEKDVFPVWAEISLPAPTTVSRVVINAATPWQGQSTLVDYELQYEKDAQWVTIERVKEPTKTFGVYSPTTRTSVDSFFADRSIFEHTFAPVTTQKVRVLVHDATWGGGATQIVGEAGGQTGDHRVVLREIEVYGPEPAAAVRLSNPSPFISAPAKKTLNLRVNNKTDKSVQVTAKITVPSGWKATPAQLPVTMSARELKNTPIALTPPALLTGGPVPVNVALVDQTGKVVDTDTFTLTVLTPIDVAPKAPQTINATKQPLTAVLTNLSKKTVTGTIKLQISEVTANGKGKVFTQQLKKTIPAFGKVTAQFNVPGLRLTGSAWRITYTFSDGKMATVVAQNVAIRPWMVLGPFWNDFDKAYGPEQGVDLTKKYTVQGSAVQAGWKPAVNNTDGLVDFTTIFTPNTNVSAYAVLYVKSPTARKVLLSAGSDDGIKTWINGQIVIDHNIGRGAAPGQEQVQIDLNAGWNEVLLKITQGGGGWGYYCELLTPDGKPIPDLSYASSPGK